MRLGFGLCLALPSLSVEAAVILANPESAAGQWDMSLGQTNRKCRMTLHVEAAGAAHGVAMPAGCRRALPILSTVSTWSVNDATHIELDDAAGHSVIDFVAGASNAMTASGPEGETYQLVAVAQNEAAGQTFRSPDGTRTPGFAPAQPAQIAAASAASEIAAARPRDMAGRYAILRDGGKDTGCMLTLDDRSHGRGGNRAALAPACRDQGIVIFDPIAWQIVGGRLVLTARKGHTTHLDWQQNGTWLKDPKEGKGLALKKM